MQGETGGLTLLFCSRCALNVDGWVVVDLGREFCLGLAAILSMSSRFNLRIEHVR